MTCAGPGLASTCNLPGRTTKGIVVAQVTPLAAVRVEDLPIAFAEFGYFAIQASRRCRYVVGVESLISFNLSQRRCVIEVAATA